MSFDFLKNGVFEGFARRKNIYTFDEIETGFKIKGFDDPRELFSPNTEDLERIKQMKILSYIDFGIIYSSDFVFYFKILRINEDKFVLYDMK